jgi:hypothetical protein
MTIANNMRFILAKVRQKGVTQQFKPLILWHYKFFYIFFDVEGRSRVQTFAPFIMGIYPLNGTSYEWKVVLLP